MKTKLFLRFFVQSQNHPCFFRKREGQKKQKKRFNEGFRKRSFEGGEARFQTDEAGTFFDENARL